MKLISIGTDRKLFEEASAVRQRAVEYGRFFDEMHVVVFTTRSMNYESRIKLSDNIFVYPTRSRNKLFYIYDAFRISKAIIRNSRFKIQDSVVTCQDPFETGLVGAFIKLFFGLPLHIQIHTDLMHPYFRRSSILNKIRVLMAEFILKYSDRVRVVSERVKKSIEKFSPNIDVLPIKAEIATASGEAVPEVKKPFPFTLLMVCRLEREKNIETVLKAVKSLDDKDIGLWIVGDGSQRKNLEQAAHDLGISERVVFAGWQDNLAPYYKKADVFVSASLYEGYGVSTVEAASFGKSLLLSDTGLSGDVFKKDDSALVCDALDAECFATNISRLYRDNNLLERMAKRAREEAEKHLNAEADYSKKYADLVEKTTEGFSPKSFLGRAVDFKRKFFSSIIYARYLICGLTSAAINILLLYIFADKIGIFYLYSSVLAFLISLVISFILQKFVVFKDIKTRGIPTQFSKFFLAALLGVITNTAIFYMCTEKIHIWYILSQVIAGFFVMIQNFVLYRFFIFNR